MMLNKIKECQDKINDLNIEVEYMTDQLKELVKGEKLDNADIDFLYWETNLSTSEISELINLPSGYIYPMIKEKSVTVECPRCGKKRLEYARSKRKLNKIEKVRLCKECERL